MMFRTTMASVLALGMAASAATNTVGQLSSQAQTKIQTKQVKNVSAASQQIKPQNTTSALSKASMGQDGNGGGGVVKNGEYMTFYSAGLYVEPSGPSGSSQLEIPGLNEVISYISKFPVSTGSKSPILAALVPTEERNYYVAKPDTLTPDVRKRLLAEFQRVTGVNTDNLTLFALTDTQNKVTFLLPEFFKLSPPDQQTILFHEAYWLVHPNAQYNDVVKAEMAFEAALQAPNDLARTSDFMNQIGTPAEAYEAKIKWELTTDLQSGALQGLIQHNSHGYYIPLQALVGDETIACENTSDGATKYGQFEYDPGLYMTSTCEPYFHINENRVLGQYPKSLILQSWKKTALRHDSWGAALLYSGYLETWDPRDLQACKVYISSGENVECAMIDQTQGSDKVSFQVPYLANVGKIIF